MLKHPSPHPHPPPPPTKKISEKKFKNLKENKELDGIFANISLLKLESLKLIN
jgi:hypothetical protein